MEWSYQPVKRLRQLSSMSPRAKETWLRRISPPAGYRPWPHGMPTSAAPVWIAIGLTPGGGKGKEKPLKSSDDQLTFGQPAGKRPTEDCPNGDGLFWGKDTDYFVKIRSLFLKLGHLHDSRLSEDSCLALSGHLNLGTGQNADGSKASLEPQIIRWISSLLANHFRPTVIIALGWFGRLGEISKHWNHAGGLHVEWDSPRLMRFEADGRNYHFRIWVGKNRNGDSVTIIGWPNHPRKRPFTEMPIWQRSLNRIPQLLSVSQ